jgi:hypothetical protein
MTACPLASTPESSAPGWLAADHEPLELGHLRDPEVGRLVRESHLGEAPRP